MSEKVNIERVDLERLRSCINEALEILDKYGLSESSVPTKPKLSKKKERELHFDRLLSKGISIKRK